MRFDWGLAVLCYLSLWNPAWTTDGLKLLKPNSTVRPGFPRPTDTNDPTVRRAARFGVYRYNNSSNDLFLFKESQITKALVQVVRGLKYLLNVEISRTVCDKRRPSNLDSCDFQKKKKLQQTFRCYFEVWIVPWLQQVNVPVTLCH
ncbi:cystatin-F [Carettochelys insculpta]|uniref:cystatin-F n=1 Tax=Carettochelys insculpta TaxID=44489 RepID=UPI003EBF9376